MPNTAERWTAARVRALPDDGNRYELIDGELVVTPAPRGRHQAVLAELFGQLQSYVRQSGAGHLLWSPADISLGDDEILQPDLFVCRTESGAPPGEWSDITGLILVVEAISPSSARTDRHLKRRRYQRAGVPEYWVVDTDARTVERWRPEDSQPEMVSGKLTWRASQSAPALEIDLAAMFAAALG